MREWLSWPEFGAVAPALVFAAGALTAILLRRAIVFVAGRLTRRRARAFAPDDPRRIWAELKELRSDCAACATGLEAAVARLKDTTTAHLRERNRNAEQLQRLREARDQSGALIEALERQVAEHELLRAHHGMELQRKDEELARRSHALANAEQTNALLRGMLDVQGRARVRSSSRAAG
jgi:hypothetical protein